MFKLLKSITDLFSVSSKTAPEFDSGYTMDEAIEGVVDGIDAKLRLVPGYKKKLQHEVNLSLSYIDQLVEQIPGPIDVSRRTFTTDPQVRSYFATPNVLQDTFSCGSELTSFLNSRTIVRSNNAVRYYALKKKKKRSWEWLSKVK